MLTGVELGAAIDSAIKRKGVKKVDVAAHFGVKPPSVQDWIKRGTIEKAKLPELWSYFSDVVGPRHWGLTSFPARGAARPPSDVGDELAIKRTASLPLVGEVRGGHDGYLEELQYPVGHGEGVVEYPTSDPNAYALRVRGDSMHPRYRAGEFVIVEPGIEPQDGDDVIVLCADGRKMLKQLNWRHGDEVQLLSINNGYAPVTLRADEIDSIQLAAGRARRSALRKL